MELFGSSLKPERIDKLPATRSLARRSELVLEEQASEQSLRAASYL